MILEILTKCRLLYFQIDDRKNEFGSLTLFLGATRHRQIFFSSSTTSTNYCMNSLLYLLSHSWIKFISLLNQSSHLQVQRSLSEFLATFFAISTNTFGFPNSYQLLGNFSLLFSLFALFVILFA